MTKAILLRAVDYRESDRIVELLTEAEGGISAIARGARRSRRRFAGALPAMCVLSVQLVHGRGRLARLERAEVRRAFPHLLANLEAMQAAGAGLRWVRKLAAERQSDTRLFRLAVELLERLDRPAPPSPAFSLCFELRALGVAGFAPAWDQCGACGRRPGAAQPARFEPRTGALLCRACGVGSVPLAPALRAKLIEAGGSGWAAAAAGFSNDALVSARNLLKLFVGHRL